MGVGWEGSGRGDWFHLCHSMVIAALCSPRLAATWGPSRSEQGEVWEVGRHRNGSYRSSSWTEHSNGEPAMGSSPRE